MIFYEFFRILFSYFRGLKLKQKKENKKEKKKRIGKKNWLGRPAHTRTLVHIALRPTSFS
jgi:hypothetical protein